MYNCQKVRNKQINRAIGSVATISAFAYRHRQGRPYVYPAPKPLSYAENFLYMIDRYSNADYRPNAELAKALDVLFILHADHELNCSTSAMRHLTSSGVDVYTSLAGAAGALYGPRHGGANEVWSHHVIPMDFSYFLFLNMFIFIFSPFFSLVIGCAANVGEHRGKTEYPVVY